MHLRLTAIDEPTPGADLRARFERLWPSYERWYFQENGGPRPTYFECQRALERHMPAMVPLWQQLVEAAGG
ncbi:MAG: hypothetical protein KDC38_05670, partial [Planctomycetes bacterium]|nr:hypothetical protein [Planctomycetota bacterium]